MLLTKAWAALTCNDSEAAWGGVPGARARGALEEDSGPQRSHCRPEGNKATHPGSFTARIQGRLSLGVPSSVGRLWKGLAGPLWRPGQGRGRLRVSNWGEAAQETGLGASPHWGPWRAGAERQPRAKAGPQTCCQRAEVLGWGCIRIPERDSALAGAAFNSHSELALTENRSSTPTSFTSDSSAIYCHCGSADAQGTKLGLVEKPKSSSAAAHSGSWPV